jgi:hypothetical protein
MTNCIPMCGDGDHGAQHRTPQVQTLLLSTLFTGLLGAGGFYVLKSAGMFSQERAELPSAAEVARMLRSPKVRRQVAFPRSRAPPPLTHRVCILLAADSTGCPRRSMSKMHWKRSDKQQDTRH